MKKYIFSKDLLIKYLEERENENANEIIDRNMDWIDICDGQEFKYENNEVISWMGYKAMSEWCEIIEED